MSRILGYHRIITLLDHATQDFHLARLKSIKGVEQVYTDVDPKSHFNQSNLHQLIQDVREHNNIDKLYVLSYRRLHMGSMKQLVDTLYQFLIHRCKVYVLGARPEDDIERPREVNMEEICMLQQFNINTPRERMLITQARARRNRNGKAIGRPSLQTDRVLIVKMRQSGKSIRQIAKELCVSSAHIHRVVSEFNQRMRGIA